MLLLTPNSAYKRQYLEMIEFWTATGEPLAPWVLELDRGDFDGLVRDLVDWSKGVGVQEGWVPSTTFWLYDETRDKMLGALNIRHELNASLLRAFGHIGYGIRPDERKKGYAAQALRLALDKCRGMGLQKVLLGCDAENVASARVIEKNGGILENEVPFEGSTVRRYWIAL